MLHLCMCNMCKPGANEGREKAPGLESQMVVACVLGIKPKNSIRGSRAFNFWVNFTDPESLFF